MRDPMSSEEMAIATAMAFKALAGVLFSEHPDWKDRTSVALSRAKEKAAGDEEKKLYDLAASMVKSIA